MKFELNPVELKDRDFLEEHLKKNQFRPCDLCFANIYLWRHHYPVAYTVVEDCVVFLNPNRMDSCSVPYGDEGQVKKALPVLEQIFADMGKPFAMHLVTEQDFARFEEWFPGRYVIEYDRDEADYVYETEKLINLSGQKYHGKKNHINKFKKTYPDWSYEKITAENLEECIEMASLWRKQNDCDADDEKLAEICVSKNSLKNLETLGLQGGLIRADGRVVAFSVGEPLTDNMYVVHIEKAYADVPGAYTIINQQFLEHEAADYQYVNREDDVGEEGLRKAKESYHPAFLLQKGFMTRA